MGTDASFQLIETRDALDKAVAALTGAARIGVDAEMSGMHSYRTCVCLLQVATPDVEIVVDVLAMEDLGPLGELLASPDVCTVVHGAVHDVRCLKADFGVGISGLFDTYIAAQFLGIEKVGLGSLVSERFGTELDKDLQTIDWRKRPLTDAQMAYLRADIRYLLPLADQLEQELKDKDLLEEAYIEFARVERMDAQPQSPEPGDWRRVKGTRDLSPEGQAMLRELWLLRERLAEHYDQPPGRLLRDASLIDVIAQRPTTPAALSELKGFPRKLAARHAKEFLEALRRGEQAGEPPPDERKKAGKAPSPAERRARRARSEALRGWRKAEAERRSVPTMVILPTYALEDLAAHPPEPGEDLADRVGIGPKRAALYADQIRAACERAVQHGK